MTLIDADKYFNLIVNAKSAMQCIEKLHSMPAVDAVPVVRCNDCKHSRKYKLFGKEELQCERSSLDVYFWVEKDDFCSYGEKVTE